MKFEKWDRVSLNDPKKSEAIIKEISWEIAFLYIPKLDIHLPRPLEFLNLIESFKDMKKGIKSSIQVFRENTEAMHKTVLWDNQQKNGNENNVQKE